MVEIACQEKGGIFECGTSEQAFFHQLEHVIRLRPVYSLDGQTFSDVHEEPLFMTVLWPCGLRLHWRLLHGMAVSSKVWPHFDHHFGHLLICVCSLVACEPDEVRFRRKSKYERYINPVRHASPDRVVRNQAASVGETVKEMFPAWWGMMDRSYRTDLVDYRGCHLKVWQSRDELRPSFYRRCYILEEYRYSLLRNVILVTQSLRR